MIDKEHFLVVGGGLGGLCIVQHLLDQGKRVTLIDRGINKSSIVAAGLINPLVFRRMTKSWRLDELLPYAESFYHRIEEETGQHFFHPISIRRFFSSEQEKGFWMEKQELPEYKKYMSPLTTEDLNFREHKTKNDFGSARVKHAAWVNTAIFIKALNKKLNQQCEIILSEFDYSKLDPLTGEYNGNRYSHVIFCNGYENVFNPYFNYLPVQTTKGEVLTVSSSDLPPDESINRKCFVLPIRKNEFRIGATYVWDTPDDQVTEDGKNEIINKLEALGTFDLEITEHNAGIRPTAPDRRPIIGRHPEFEQLYLFNGLGTKGYMIAPLLSKEFVDFIITGKPIDPETDLKRFLK